MDGLCDLVLAMLVLAVAAVMLVAGELYLVTRPDPTEMQTPQSRIVTSSNAKAGRPARLSQSGSAKEWEAKGWV